MRRRSIDILLTCGLVAPALFIGGVLAQDVLTPGYDPIRQFVSHLSLSPYGWVNQALLIVVGALVIAFAAGVGRPPTHDRVRVIRIPLFVLGAAIVAAGVFTIDPGLGYPVDAPETGTSWHGRLHDVAGGLVFLAAVAATILSGRRMRASAHWRGLARPSYVAAGVIVVCFVLASVATALDYAGTVRPGLAGLAERIYLFATFAWVAAFAHRARTAARAGHPRSGATRQTAVADHEPVAVTGAPGSSTDRST